MSGELSSKRALAHARAEIDALRAALRDAESDLTPMREYEADLRELNHVLDGLLDAQREHEATRTERDALAAELAAERDAAASAREAAAVERAASAAALTAVTQRYEVVVRSASWRLTKPLRRVAARARGPQT